MSENILAMDADLVPNEQIESNLLLAALDDHAIVCATDCNGIIIYANRKFCEISGYTRDELLGRKHQLINAEYHSALFIEQIGSTIAAGERWSGIVCNRSKSGALYWVKTTITPVRDDAGNPYQYIAICTEITENKEYQQRLEANRQFLELLNKNANNLLAVGESQFMRLFEYIAGEWGEILGADHWFICQANDHNSAHPRVIYQAPEVREAISTNVAKWESLPSLPSSTHDTAVPESSSPRFEVGPDIYLDRRLLESIGFLSSITIPVINVTETRYLLCFLGSRADTFSHCEHQLHFTFLLSEILSSACMRAEQENQYKTQRRSLSTRQWLAHLGDWDLDINSSTVRWSPALFGVAERKSKIPLEEFANQIHKHDRLGFISRLNDSVNEFQPFSYEFRLLTEDNEFVWVQMRGARIRGPGPLSNTLIATLIDVTESKKIEKELSEAQHKAQRANRAKSQFLSAMSHELRTPLNSILGFSQLLELDPNLNDAQQANVAEILTAGNHLLQLINDILDLSVVESGSLHVVLEDVNLADVINETIHLISPIASKRGITINLHNADGLAVFADTVRLRQVLINLVSNAVKYNKVNGSIDILCQATADQQIRIAVTDTGSGIDPAKQADLFKPFNRLGWEKSTIEGTGIGLSYSKAVLQLMGGTIGFQSTPEVGSTFHITMAAAVPRLDAPRQLADADGINGGFAELQQHSQMELLYISSINPVTDELIQSIVARQDDIRLHTELWESEFHPISESSRPQLIIFDMGDLDRSMIVDTLGKLGVLYSGTPLVGILDSGRTELIAPLLRHHCSKIYLTPIDSNALRKLISDISEVC